MPAIVAFLVLLFILTELAAAVLPLVIVIVLVPPQDREALARVIAACDTSRKLRIWSALRLAVVLSRQERRPHQENGQKRRQDAGLQLAETSKRG